MEVLIYTYNIYCGLSLYPGIIILLSLYNRYLLTQGTLYHKGLSYLIQFIKKSLYILCSGLDKGDFLNFLIFKKVLTLLILKNLTSQYNLLCIK